MAYQLPSVSLVMFGATVLMLVSAGVAYRNRAVPGAMPFAVFMGCATVWAATYGVQLVFRSLDVQLFWTNFQYPAGLFTCITFGVFVLHYTGRDHRLGRARLVAASVVPLVASAVVWIPGLRWLMWREATLVRVNGFYLADIDHGPLFDVAVAYSYLVVVGSLVLLGLTALRTRALYRKQTAIITITATVPLIGGAVAYGFEITVIDYTPVGLAVFGVGVVVALTRYQLLDVYPVPRNRIINQIDTGIVVTDRRDRVVDINPAAGQVLDRSAAVGVALSDMDSVAATEMAAMATDTSTELRVGEEDPRYFACGKSRLASEGGFGETHLYLLTEVTERRRRQRALEAKNDRLDSFAEVLSHDLRNPLSVAAGSAELAREEPAPEHFDRLDDAHDRMDEIIDTMLTLSRSGQSVADPEVVDIETVVREAWSVIRAPDASLSVAGTADIAADPTRLQQLFENLFRNAIEHGGSDVTVRVGVTETGFFVADDGPGIPEDQREAVFTPGTSSATDGTGMGLAIVRTVADGHEWSISVTESESGGARFDVRM